MRKQRSFYPVIAYGILQALDAPMNVTKIKGRANISSQKAGILLKEMEERGLVEKCDNIYDGRRDATYYQVTVKGRRLREDAKPLMELK